METLEFKTEDYLAIYGYLYSIYYEKDQTFACLETSENDRQLILNWFLKQRDLMIEDSYKNEEDKI